VPTLLELIGIDPPAAIGGCAQMPIEGESFARSIAEPAAPSKSSPQYFEMFGHRGIWHGGWKAVAYHPPGTPFENDKWELFHLDNDFSEVDDLAGREGERLAGMIALWWREAEKHQVLPLDDRFGARFAENAARFHGARSHFTFHAGMGHVPTDVAPDVRSRSYTIEAHVEIDEWGAEGVLVAHGDATSGYSLYVKDGHLVHDLNIGGSHQIVTSNRELTPGAHRLQRLHAVDRRRAGRSPDHPACLQHADLLVGPRYRPRPRQPGVALRGAIRVHRAVVTRHRGHA
jgi:hypothetical protein